MEDEDCMKKPEVPKVDGFDLTTTEGKYYHLLYLLGVNGHDGAISEIKTLRRSAGLDK